jgi:addiction module RelB/DinJ family antitoxin
VPVGADLDRMTSLVKSSKIQARVLPLIKEASEAILWRMGLNMSEAFELFLHRVIVDSALPFQVQAISTERLLEISEDVIRKDENVGTFKRLTYRGKKLPGKKTIQKDFLGVLHPTYSRGKKK